MKRLLPLLLLLTASSAWAAPLPGKADVPLPRGLPPRLTTARVSESGELVLTELVPVNVTYTAAIEVVAGGKKTVQEEVRTRVGYNAVERAMKPAGLVGYDVRGRKLGAKALARALNKRTVVAVSADGQPVDPLYLAALKEGTVVLVFPPDAYPRPKDKVVRPTPGPGGTPD